MRVTSLIKSLLPKNSYEKEAFIKAFFLFFTTTEILLAVIFLLLVRIEIDHRKHGIFLELVNYSYTFKGDKYKLELVDVNNSINFYRLMEGEEGLYIIIPIPGVKKEAFKIIYPREEFIKDIKNIFLNYISLFGLFSFVNVVLSLGFALYTMAPLRKAIDLITNVAKDIAHDMNTPITTLLINLKLLKNRYDDESIGRMESAVNRLIYLSKNLNTLTEKSVFRYEEVNLKDIILEVLSEFRSVYPEAKVKTELENVKLPADRNVVKRILDNVISNAFKHRNKDGEVKIILKKNELMIENPSKPIKNIDRIFERFYRESERGLGLGLSVVKKLSEELGWQVKAEYKDGNFKLKILFHGRKSDDRDRGLS